MYHNYVTSIHIDANLFQVKEALKLNMEWNHHLHLVKEKMPENTAIQKQGALSSVSADLTV